MTQRRSQWLLALLTAPAYALLAWWALGDEVLPGRTRWHWGTDFEHGELVLAHWADAVAILVAAFPVGAAVAGINPKKGAWVCLVVGTAVALVYLAAPQPVYRDETSWLLDHSDLLQALKLMLAPAAWYAVVRMTIRLAASRRTSAT